MIDSGLSVAPSTNLPFVTVTICTPGSTTQCQTIDHILLDTGSSGLRVLASVLTSGSPSLTLTPVTLNGNPVTECLPFVDGSSYGPVREADVVLGGETLSSLPIEVVGDSSYSTVPSDCTGTAENTVAAFGANGLLGVSTVLLDCGANGATGTNAVADSFYYECPTTTTCTATALATTLQVPNPVSRLSQNNNGVILELPAVADGGAGSVQGSLILGIGTQTNNALPSSATVLQLSSTGLLTTTYEGRTLTNSFIDSGSNFLYFNDSSLTRCTGSYAGFYCPSTVESLSATLSSTSTNSSSSSSSSSSSPSVAVSFKIGNAQTLYSSGNHVYDDMGATTSVSHSFDWGLPFFLGRNIYTAFQPATTGATVAGTVGPWVAF